MGSRGGWGSSLPFDGVVQAGVQVFAGDRGHTVDVLRHEGCRLLGVASHDGHGHSAVVIAGVAPKGAL